ncbi:MAG: hypothetical protein F6K35_18600 [Okeania sp. SIO2H7]|nr:hypothetical protein [Okeania sp. SIO2H7]
MDSKKEAIKRAKKGYAATGGHASNGCFLPGGDRETEHRPTPVRLYKDKGIAINAIAPPSKSAFIRDAVDYYLAHLQECEN